MPTNDIHGREKYEFTYKEVEYTDVGRTTEEMFIAGWHFQSQDENKSKTKVVLGFYREKTKGDNT